MHRKLIFPTVVAMLLSGCSGNVSSSAGNGSEVKASMPDTAISRVDFNADSAYTYIKRQVEFGSRVPGTSGHRQCAQYIIDELSRHGVDSIITQNAIVSAFNGDQLPITNIMGRINPNVRKRVLLVAHYDTRPWADNESDKEARNTPIPGANDGGSGVGALLEIARVFKAQRPQIGVDFLFVDAEDYGNSSGFGGDEETWCLGTQYWVNNMPYTASTQPMYGIVLDMVAGINARFHREYNSNKSARAVVDKVWGQAARSGFSSFFPNEVGGSLIDDHIFIDRAGIPCIDIVECNNVMTRSFPPTWHTHNDNMNSIDTAPLRAVGQTVVNVVMSEKGD